MGLPTRNQVRMEKAYVPSWLIVYYNRYTTYEPQEVTSFAVLSQSSTASLVSTANIPYASSASIQSTQSVASMISIASAASVASTASTASIAQESVSSAQKAKTTQTGIIAGSVVAGVVLIVALVVFFFWQKRRERRVAILNAQQGPGSEGLSNADYVTDYVRYSNYSKRSSQGNESALLPYNK
jgi:Na+/melibiose symporter-like transporter